MLGIKVKILINVNIETGREQLGEVNGQLWEEWEDRSEKWLRDKDVEEQQQVVYLVLMWL